MYICGSEFHRHFHTYMGPVENHGIVPLPSVRRTVLSSQGSRGIYHDVGPMYGIIQSAGALKVRPGYYTNLIDCDVQWRRWRGSLVATRLNRN